MDPIKVNQTLAAIAATAASWGETWTAEDSAYQISNYYEDKAPVLIAGSVTLIVITTLCVVLRLVARRVRGISWEVDDYMVVVALVTLTRKSHLV